MNREDGSALELAFRHAWEWFALHAQQRMQAMNFFLIAVAFISAGLIGAVRANLFGISLAVGLIGLLLSLGFYLLEVRTRQLVKIAESALEAIQDELVEATGMEELRFLALADRPKFRGAKYSVAFKVIYLAVTGGFLATVVYSTIELCS